MLTRRGLFGFAATATALPFARADNHLAREKPKSLRLQAKMGAPATRVAILEVEGGDSVAVIQGGEARRIGLHSQIELEVERTTEGSRVHAIYVDGAPLDLHHAQCQSNQ